MRLKIKEERPKRQNVKIINKQHHTSNIYIYLMENNNTANIGEKIKAVAITFIGAGIFSQGTFYFQEQYSYRIPRILYPIYELFGNTGLAISMLTLGLALVFWAYTKWKNTESKAGIFALVAIAAFAIFFSILFFTGKKATPEELMQSSEETRAKGIEKMAAMEKPNFDNIEVEQQLTAFETLLQQRKNAFNEKDQQAIKASDQAYINWTEKSASLIQKLKTPEEKQQFALYLGKLGMKWQEIK